MRRVCMLTLVGKVEGYRLFAFALVSSSLGTKTVQQRRYSMMKHTDEPFFECLLKKKTSKSMLFVGN